MCPICYGKGYYIDKLWFETVKRKCTLWCRVKAWFKRNQINMIVYVVFIVIVIISIYLASLISEHIYKGVIYP